MIWPTIAVVSQNAAEYFNIFWLDGALVGVAVVVGDFVIVIAGDIGSVVERVVDSISYCSTLMSLGVRT